MVIIGDIIASRNIKSAGRIYDEDWWCEKSEGINKRAELFCPNCKKRVMPLLNKHIVYEGTTYPWCDLDHQDVETYHVTTCPKCKKDYRFTVYIGQ